MSTKIRLHQYLSKTGEFASKKEILEKINACEVEVDGRTVDNPDYQFRKSSEVKVSGKKVQPAKENIYIAINKPTGYLSSRLTDEDIRLGKKSVFSLIKTGDEKLDNSLFTVGRLDEDTSGLLIITNDGKLSHRITDPESEIEKTYLAKLAYPLKKEELKRLREGVEITLEENGVLTRYKTRPAKIEMKDSIVSVTLKEGKKREVRRMFEAVKNRVIALKRIKIGKLDLKDLNIKEGEYKILEKIDVNDS